LSHVRLVSMQSGRASVHHVNGNMDSLQHNDLSIFVVVPDKNGVCALQKDSKDPYYVTWNPVPLRVDCGEGFQLRAINKAKGTKEIFQLLLAIVYPASKTQSQTFV
jgi:hypothetical protein